MPTLPVFLLFLILEGCHRNEHVSETMAILTLIALTVFAIITIPLSSRKNGETGIAGGRNLDKHAPIHRLVEEDRLSGLCS